jgi:hypothetical protein
MPYNHPIPDAPTPLSIMPMAITGATMGQNTDHKISSNSVRLVRDLA